MADGNPFGLGATGRRTQPPIDASDQGELRGALVLDRESNSLILYFGQRVSWVAMKRSEAISLGEALISKASELND
jgi:hypothetical protein